MNKEQLFECKHDSPKIPVILSDEIPAMLCDECIKKYHEMGNKATKKKWKTKGFKIKKKRI